MKKLLLLLFALIIGNTVYSKNVINNPPFSVRNTFSLDVEKITINKKETKIDFVAFAKANEFFSLSSACYIRVGDEMIRATGYDGIRANEPTYKREADTLRFTLTFPPIDPGTELIDFVERGECEECFKIWGIELHAGNLNNRVEVPENIRLQAQNLNDRSPLKTPVLKEGVAILKGQIPGYIPELDYKLQIMYRFPITNEWLDKKTDINSDGSFEFEIQASHDIQVYCVIGDVFRNSIVLTPGETSELYIDLQQRYARNSKADTSENTESKWAFFTGANADINNQNADFSLVDLEFRLFDYDKIMYDIETMTFPQYKAYMLGKKDDAFKSLDKLPLLPKTRELSEINIWFKTIYFLMMGDSFLESTYRIANNKSREEPLPDYKNIITFDYYDFLKDSPVNNQKALYSSDYKIIINSFRSLVYKFSDRYPVLLDVTPEMYLDIKKNNKLSADENELISYLITQHPDNWKMSRIEKFKSEIANFITNLQAGGQLNETEKEISNDILSLTKTPGNNINNLSIKIKSLYMKLHKRGGFNTEIQVLDALLTTREDSAPELQKRIEQFYNKYQSDIEFYREQFLLENTRKLLADILHTDKGIIFDLVEVFSYARNFEENTPVSERELNQLSQSLQNPFYYQYLKNRSDKLVAELEEKKARGDFLLLKLPETEEDKILYEIIKPFVGKVILIDFWETWCGPCRSAMRQFEPYKQELKNKGVAFIYLASESSPLSNWENMITDIKGSHYRLTREQSSYLRDKFGVRGVPSYLILSKTGEQVYFKVGFEGVERISEILNEELAK